MGFFLCFFFDIYTEIIQMIDYDYAPTQTQTILDHLQSGKQICTWDAYQLYNITCLAQRIHELRKKGYIIDDQMVFYKNRRFKIYWLADINDHDIKASITAPVTSEVTCDDE